MDILCVLAIIAGRFFSLHCAVANVWAEFTAPEPDIILEKEVLLSPCPVLDRVLATDTSDPAIAKGAECAVDPERSITSESGFPVSFAPDPILGKTGRSVLKFIPGKTF